jgi:hypothetical protein
LRLNKETPDKILQNLSNRVADPHSFHPDPDPAFQAEYRSGSNTNPDPIRIQGFNDQKLKKKITAEKNLNFFGIKTYNLPIPRPP